MFAESRPLVRPELLQASQVQAREVEVVLDDAGNIASLKGKPTERLIRRLAVGAPFLDFVDPQDIPLLEHNASWLAEDSSRTASIVMRVGRPGGRFSEVCARLSLGDEGLKVVLQDLTAVRSAEHNMRFVVEGSKQGVIVRSGEEVLYCNDAFAQMIGYPTARDVMMLGRSHVNNFIHPDDVGLVLERLNARIAGTEVLSHYEFRLGRRDGTYVWAETLASLCMWDGKRASLSWITDISARKCAEDEIVRAKEAAEFANRSKSQFLANMSHELRTPLNAILGFSQIITEQMFGPVGSAKYLEYVADIHSSGKHLLHLINDILDLSKLEAGKLELRESLIDVPPLVEDCLTFVRERAKTACVQLVFDTPDGLPTLRADERSVKQILLNLLSNAIKFTPQGGCVTLRVRLTPNQTINFSVSDTGIGMSSAEIDIAFTPFGQVDSEVVRRHEGTGLGLPLSRSLARLHGGDLTIQSAPGKGTTVTLFFPADRVVRAAA
jgi:PAS domain S-box-containing protein